MKIGFPSVAVACLVSVGISGIATSSNGHPSTSDRDPQSLEIKKSDLRVRTDDYLIPANICVDADAEKYEDCVPWAQVGENAIFVLPEVE